MTIVEAVETHPFVDGFVYGEGPRWHDGRLWFTDGPAGKVYSTGETGDLRVELELERGSGLGWLADGTLVVSTLFASVCHFVDPSGRLTSTCDLSEFGVTTNDLVVSPAGHVYVDVYYRHDDALVGDICLVYREGARRVATGLAVPNGLGFLPDGATLVANETNGGRILAYPTRPDGSLGEPTVFADLEPGRHPDGLCVDAEGAVWVGSYDTGEFLRVQAGGAITHRVEIQTGWSVAPALGGSDGRTLYLVVDDTTIEGLVTGASTGRVLQARVEVPGIGSP